MGVKKSNSLLWVATTLEILSRGRGTKKVKNRCSIDVARLIVAHLPPAGSLWFSDDQTWISVHLVGYIWTRCSVALVGLNAYLLRNALVSVSVYCSQKDRSDRT